MRRLTRGGERSEPLVGGQFASRSGAPVTACWVITRTPPCTMTWPAVAASKSLAACALSIQLCDNRWNGPSLSSQSRPRRR
ncbi:hypothetical protein [Amycolatopsis sp. NBC_01286]|uniref:hypothetical protein n=1 Tax=Amycolatopsis sp. NBC_01286 TaxID=2903560 RepID=UPI002E0FA787|nr:hypothetical protein OG570_23640 [Amycolatopsis sp. NBC_01286]